MQMLQRLKKQHRGQLRKNVKCYSYGVAFFTVLFQEGLFL